MNDPTGLIAPFLLLAMGAAGALSLGLTGSYGAASITDGLKTRRTGRESNEAWDAVTKVAPEVYKAHSKAFLPGKVVVGAVAGVPSWMRASQVALEILTNGRGDSFDPEKYKK